MALSSVDTYEIVKSGKYYKTIQSENVIKINTDSVVMTKDLNLEFDPEDTESVPVSKAFLNGGVSIIVRKDTL